MTNQMTIFNNAEFGEIRTVEINNEPWFVGKDVAIALGYADPNKAIANRRRVLGNVGHILSTNLDYIH